MLKLGLYDRWPFPLVFSSGPLGPFQSVKASSRFPADYWDGVVEEVAKQTGLQLRPVKKIADGLSLQERIVEQLARATGLRLRPVSSP